MLHLSSAKKTTQIDTSTGEKNEKNIEEKAKKEKV